MNSNSTLQTHFMTDREVFLNMLGSIALIDIGVIDSVDLNGRAHVTSSTFIENRPVKYSDAEIIYPGNAYGCYTTKCTGMACLIFIPKSCMPNISDLKLRIGATPYNRDGVKVMPIGNGSSNRVRAMFSDDGVYNIISKLYTVQYTEDSISFQRNDGKTTLTVDQLGQLSVTRRSDKGTLDVNVTDEGVTSTWLSQDKSVLWTDTLNPDGSRTIIQSNPSDEEGDPLSSVTIAPDGTVSITGKEIQLNGDDKRLVLYGELEQAMQKLWTAMTTTPIAGNGSAQPSWTGLPDGIDISAAETQTIKTGG